MAVMAAVKKAAAASKTEQRVPMAAEKTPACS
jgi:hypothetical protein